MKTRHSDVDLSKVTGKRVKEWWRWLVCEQGGCCSVCFASTEKYRYYVCMGWQPGYGPASEEKWLGKDGKFHQSFCPPVNAGEEDKGWRICWKIGRQTHNNIMRCDYDIDFEMPYVTESMAKECPDLCEGDVDNTDETVELKSGMVARKEGGYVADVTGLGAPVGYRSWDDLAKFMRKVARRVWRDWKDCDE